MDEDDDTPAGFISFGDDLMAYWTEDGRSIEEIWSETHEPSQTDEPPF